MPDTEETSQSLGEIAAQSSDPSQSVQSTQTKNENVIIIDSDEEEEEENEGDQEVMAV